MSDFLIESLEKYYNSNPIILNNIFRNFNRLLVKWHVFDEVSQPYNTLFTLIEVFVNFVHFAKNKSFKFGFGKG